MLSQLLKLPFRRDAIEKVLEDHLRRGLVLNLQLFGQLSSSLGLHVMSSHVPAVAGTRLSSAVLLPWHDGFALVIASNEQGLILASPNQGIVTLAPPELVHHFPDGIELLLIERSISTPDHKFRTRLVLACSEALPRCTYSGAYCKFCCTAVHSR